MTSCNHEIFEAEVSGIRAWLVIDTQVDGLSFGGFRFSESVSLDEVRTLAETMSLKLACHGRPVGGAKAGIACDPNHPDIYAILTELAETWESVLRSRAILGKDMGATNALIDHFYSSVDLPQLGLVKKKNEKCPDKIRHLNGYLTDMTGLGAVIAAEAVEPLEGKTVIIQGAGVVAQGIAMRLKDKGVKIIGISDIEKTISNPHGIDLPQRIADCRMKGMQIDLSQLGTDGATSEQTDHLLSIQADVLFLAAGSNSVSGTIAQSIKTPLIVEASNFGLTQAANITLANRDIKLIPDLISSSSSAAMTCLQMASGNNLGTNELWHQITENIRNAVHESHQIAKINQCTMRSAYLSIFANHKPVSANAHQT